MSSIKRTLPVGWRWVKIGEITEVSTGGTPDTNRPEYYENGNIRWLKSGDIKGTYIEEVPHRISQLGLDSSNAKTHPVGSVMLAMSGQGKTRGTSAILKVPSACSQSVAAILPSEHATPEIIHFALVNRYGETRRLTGDNERTGLNLKLIREIEIPLPPLDEQKRILASLNEKMHHIEQARQAAEESLSAAWELPSAYLSDVFNSQTAKSWETKFIKEFAETGSGATPSRSKQEYFKNGDIPWVKTGELKDSFINDTEEHITELALKETSLRLFPANTLLIAMYGQGQTRGRTSIITKPMTTNQACFAILPNDQFDTEYIQMWFQFSYDRLRRETEGRGGNQPNLNGIVLRNQKAPLPNLNIQKQIVSKVKQELSETKRLTQSLESQLAEINELPSALLRQAFAGEM